MTLLLRVEGLHKTYAGHWIFDRTTALRGIDLTVSAGEIVGLLGPNGAGKTTTFKAVTGLIRPSAGRIELFGLPPRLRRARQHLGYLPENADFHDFLTGEELVDLAARLVGVPSGRRRARVGDVLDRVGLGEARRRRLRSYSKGMKQRVGLAQALVGWPRLLILDEPMTGLDPIGRREVRDLIAGLADERTGVIFSTHVLQDVELTCHRVVILAGGRVLREGSLADLLAGREAPVEMHVAGLTAAAVDAVLPGLPAARLSAVGGRVAVRAESSAVAEIVRAKVAAAGGEVTAMTPQPVSLEDVFMAEVRGVAEARP